jgi:repressor LexA
MESEVVRRPSKKQRELLDYIDGFIKEHGYGPSYREIMRSLDYKSVSTVAVHVDGLIRKGHLVKKDRSARSLAVVNSTGGPTQQTVIHKADMKFLADIIDARFAEYDKEPHPKKLDDLYVLVGSLHVLGLDDAARAFKSRLLALARQG